MRHVLSALVDNQPGVLSRVAGLFSRRGFNIESLSVAPTDDPRLSRITAEIEADDVKFEQITKQLHKLVNVVKISDLAGSNAVERTLVLVRVQADAVHRKEITDTAAIFKAKVVDIGSTQITFECEGDQAKIDDFIALIRPYGISEIVRTGVIAIPRSEK